MARALLEEPQVELSEELETYVSFSAQNHLTFTCDQLHGSLHGCRERIQSDQLSLALQASPFV